MPKTAVPPNPNAITLPPDMVFRAVRRGFELRRASDDAMPTLFGHFAVFNRWTEIDSWWEGRFFERILPGAFAKTIQENRDEIKCLFQHGRDVTIGDKVLGPIEELREDPTGPYYEVPLFDTTYNRDLLPGLEAGQYGASFRFQVMKEEWREEPGTSDHNPKGLPERDILEVRCYEFGPVTFPAYKDATAGTRSLTDQIVGEALREADPDVLRKLADRIAASRGTPGAEPAKTTPAAEPPTLTDEPQPEPRERSGQHSDVTTGVRRGRLMQLTGRSTR